MSQGIRRRLATGANAVLVAVLVVVGLILVVDLAGRFRMRLDLSADAESTLENDTISALEALEDRGGQVSVTAFSAQLRNADAYKKNQLMRDFLRELDYASDAVTVRYVDFDRERRIAQDLGVSQYGTVVVEAGGRRVDLKEREVFRFRGKGPDRTIDFRGEALISRAIEQVSADEIRKVYLLTGHGELEVEPPGPQSVSAFVALMERQSWDVDTLDLLRDGGEEGAPRVPDDATAVLIVGPQAPLAPLEEDALRDFLGEGGRVGVFVEPGGTVPRLVEELGIAVPEGTVRDVKALWPHEDWPLLRPGRHVITEPIVEDDLVVLVGRAAAVQPRATDGVQVSSLIRSSRRGWVERGTERPARMTPEEDLEGPHDVVVAVDLRPPHPIMPKGRTTRVIVGGDADLLADELVEEGPGNATFAINAVRWLLDEEARVGRVGRTRRVRSLMVDAGDLTRVAWLVIGGMPLTVLLAGLGVMLARRRR